MKIKIKVILQYIFIYLCLLNTSSKVNKMFQQQVLSISLLLCLGVLFFGVAKLKKNYFYSLLIFFGFLVLQHTLLQKDISLFSVVIILNKFIVAYCAVAISREFFFDRYVKMLVFFALASIIFYFIGISPMNDFLTKILMVNYDSCWTGNISYGRFIYHYIPNYTRNVGIFNEPGVFQLFLNVALFILLFWNKKIDMSPVKRQNSIAIILVAILTAASTAGFLTTLIIIVCYIMKKQGMTGKKKVFLLTILLVFFLVFSQTEFYYKNFASKLSYSNGRFNEGTGNARLASILIDLYYIVRFPLGQGFTGTWVNNLGYALQESGSSVGLTTIVFTYGIPLAMIIYGYYIWAFRKLANYRMEFWVLLLMFISSFLAQPWVLTPVYLVFFSAAFFIENNKELGYR